MERPFQIRLLSTFDPRSARSNSIAEIQLCSGMAASGHDVELVAPNTASSADADETLYDLYGVEQNFRVRSLPSVGHLGDRAHVASLMGVHATHAIVERLPTAVISGDVRLLVPYLTAGGARPDRLLAVPWLHEFRDKTLERWVCSRASHVLATNSAILKDLDTHGIQGPRTFVTGNSVPRERVEFGQSCSRKEARARIGLTTERRVVAYTGKLYLGMRELEYLLEAARRLPEHLFVMTGGQPPVIRHLEAELAAAGVKNVHLTGRLNRPEDVRYYQQAADVLVSYYSVADHSYAHHNLPNKIAEYMTTGNPIVAAAFPSVRDLLSDRNAVLVAPDDPEELLGGLAAAIRECELGSSRAVRAQQDVAARTTEAVGSELVEFLGQAGVGVGHSRQLARRQRRRNLGSIISNETIALELSACLERHFGSRKGGALLDLGAGTRPYAPIYEPYFATCTSVDVEYSPHDIAGVDRIASADDLPFEDASFDCVVCTEVLEHCRRPDIVLGEISRVLRPEGRLFLTTPFLRPLHEMPHDYFRFTPSSLRDLGEAAGLSVEEIVPRGDYAALLLLTLQLPLTKALQRLSRTVHRRFYDYDNPLVYAAVVAPQTAYLALWRTARRRPTGAIGRAHRKLDYYALGYVSTFYKETDTGG